MSDCILPCKLKNSDYECIYWTNPTGCRGICVRNGELCEFCKLKETSKLKETHEKTTYSSSGNG